MTIQLCKQYYLKQKTRWQGLNYSKNFTSFRSVGNHPPKQGFKTLLDI